MGYTIESGNFNINTIILVLNMLYQNCMAQQIVWCRNIVYIYKNEYARNKIIITTKDNTLKSTDENLKK